MKKIVILLAALLPGLASAESVAITGKLSTLGYGLELNSRINDDWNSRVGINAMNLSRNMTESGIDYNFKLKLQTLSMLADYFPSRSNAFRMSLGLMYNNNKATMDARPTSGIYQINNINYAAANVGSLRGEMTFNKAAPYLGIGYGNPVTKGAGWSFAADLGALYQGKPKISLSATCGAAIAGTAACTTLQRDVAAEKAQAESAADNFRWWPVVSVGVSYQF